MASRRETSVGGKAPSPIVGKTAAQMEGTSQINAAGKDPGSRPARLEPSLAVSNVRTKLQLISKKGQNKNFEAISDLIEEARFNKSNILDEEQQASEMSKMLALPLTARRAVHIREITEFGRNLELPNWHGSDRRHYVVWYHCMQRVRLAEFEPGAVVMQQGEVGQACYWLLAGDAELRSMDMNPAATEAASLDLQQQQQEQQHLALQRLLSSSSSSSSQADPSSSNSPSAHPSSTTPHSAAGDGHRHGHSSRVGTAGVDAGKSNQQLSFPAVAAAAAVAAPPQPVVLASEPLELWDMVGQQALQGQAYEASVVAVSKCSFACLSAEDYRAVVEMISKETFDSLRLHSLMVMSRTKRTMQELKDLAAYMALYDLFKTMEDDFRLEVCNLVEFLAVPDGFSLFEQGDRVDFCYVILQGQVAFTKYNEQSRRHEDIGSKTTGEHFGTLTTLSSGEKRRPFGAHTTRATELAIISRVGYNRILKKQLQGAINARISLLKSLAIMNTSSYYVLQRVATNCQDETFAAGTTVIEAGQLADKMFFIVEGEAKLVWVTDDPSKLPPDEAFDPPPPKASGSGLAVGARGAVGVGRNGGTSARHKQPSSYGGGSNRTPRGAAANHRGGKASSSGAKGAASAAAAAQSKISGEAMAGYLLNSGGAGGAAGAAKLAANRKRHQLEVARLGRGDILNGLALMGKTPVFSIVATSNIKVMSLEVSAVEGMFGREATRAVRELVVRQHAWLRDTLKHIVHMRQLVSHTLMDPGANRRLHDPSHHYLLDHYVPTQEGHHGSMAPAQAQQLPPKAPQPSTSTAVGQLTHSTSSASLFGLGTAAAATAAAPSAGGAAGAARGSVGTAAAVAALANADALLSSASAAAVGLPSMGCSVATVISGGDVMIAGRKPGAKNNASRNPFAGTAVIDILDAPGSSLQHPGLRAAPSQASLSSLTSQQQLSAGSRPHAKPSMDAYMVHYLPRQGQGEADLSAQPSQATSLGGHSSYQLYAQPSHASIVPPGISPNPANPISSNPDPATGSEPPPLAAETSQVSMSSCYTESYPHTYSVGPLPGPSGEAAAAAGVPQLPRVGPLGPTGSYAPPLTKRAAVAGLDTEVSAIMAGSGSGSEGSGAPAAPSGSKEQQQAVAVAAAAAGSSSRPPEYSIQLSHLGVPEDAIRSKGAGSPMPHVPNAPAPVLVSPGLLNKVLMQDTKSEVTARYCKQRQATIVSTGHDDASEVPRAEGAGPVAGRSSVGGDPSAAAASSSSSPPAPPAAPGLHPSASLASLPSISYHLHSAHASAQVSPRGPGLGPGADGVFLPPSSSLLAPGPGSLSTSVPSLPPLDPSGLPKSYSSGAGSYGGPGRGLISQLSASSSPSVIILPKMMTVYDSVISNNAPLHSHYKGRSIRHVVPSDTPGKPRFAVRHSVSMPDDEARMSADAALIRTKQKLHIDPLAPGGINLRNLAGVGGGGEKQGGHRVAVTAAINRSEEPALPLEADVGAPAIASKLSCPTLQDINYILNRWGARWTQDREEWWQKQKARKAAAVADALQLDPEGNPLMTGSEDGGAAALALSGGQGENGSMRRVASDREDASNPGAVATAADGSVAAADGPSQDGTKGAPDPAEPYVVGSGAFRRHLHDLSMFGLPAAVPPGARAKAK